MKKFIFAALLVSVVCSVGYCQEEEEGHTDVEFGYDDFTSPTTIIIESDELTTDGIQIVEADFVELFPGDDPVSANPGFITIATEEMGGERVNSGDAVSIRFLDASLNSEAGVGFVNFYDADTDELTSAGQITAASQNDASVSVLNAGNVANGVDVVFLSLGSDGNTMSNSPEDEDVVLPVGEVHNHLVFTLSGNAPGAYGLLVQIESAPADGSPVLTSDPVWLLFNNGLDEEVFEEQAVPAFGPPFILGDVNLDGEVSFLDITAFISVLSGSGFQEEADIDGNGFVNFLDIGPFIAILNPPTT